MKVYLLLYYIIILYNESFTMNVLHCNKSSLPILNFYKNGIILVENRMKMQKVNYRIFKGDKRTL